MSGSTMQLRQVHLDAVIALARLLETVERGGAVIDADNYQRLIARLQAALAQDLPEQALDAVLGALPAAAEVYENMHYQHAGLSRAPLDRSVASELLAAKLLARVSRAPRTT
jgi:hypothetical protein